MAETTLPYYHCKTIKKADNRFVPLMFHEFNQGSFCMENQTLILKNYDSICHALAKISAVIPAALYRNSIIS